MILNVIRLTVLLIGLAFGFLEGLKLIHNTAPVPEVVYSGKKETINIDGMIYNRNLGFIDRKYTHMPDRTRELVKLVKEGVGEIHLKINSPGGLLNDGMIFVHNMRDAQRLGVRFVCVVDGIAMSMALIIFSECDKRYATFGSSLMWHSISTFVMNQMNTASTSKLLAFMQAKNEVVWANTRIHFYPWYFTEHFAKESILSASEVEANSIRYLRVIRDHKIQ